MSLGEPRPPSRWGFRFFTLHLATLWGLALSNVFLGLMILWSGWHWRQLRSRWSRVEPVLLPLGAYAILLAVSVLGSYEPAVSAEGLKEAFLWATLAVALVVVRGEQDVRSVVDVLTLMVAAVAVFGVGQFYLTDYGDLQHRIVGPFSHYQTFAGVLLLGDFLLLARVVTRRRARIWHGLALVVVNWALLLTLTRGAWLALAVTVAAFGVAGARRLLAVGLLAALAGAVFAAGASGEWRERLRSIVDLQDPSNYDRLCMIEAGLTMISERPLLGLGPGLVKRRYPIYRDPTAPRYTVPHLHDAFLNLAAERGLLSLAAYVWLFAASLRLAWRRFRLEGGMAGERADLYLGVLLALVGFNVAALFENNWDDTEVQRPILFLLALPCCLEAGEPGPDE